MAPVDGHEVYREVHDDLGSGGTPVQIALGDEDFILPEHAVELAATVPDARLALLPDTPGMTIMTPLS